jgi:hypothetical protein
VDQLPGLEHQENEGGYVQQVADAERYPAKKVAKGGGKNRVKAIGIVLLHPHRLKRKDLDDDGKTEKDQ